MRARPTLLVVDDEQDNLDYVSRVLHDQCEVLTAPSGAAALELAAKHEVAVVIADFLMPGMSGVDLLNRMMAVAPYAARIILTAHASAGLAIDAINQSKISAFLQKPVEPAVLQAAVASALAVYDLHRQREDLLRALEQKNKALEESQRMLELSLDEKSRMLLEANRRLNDVVVRDPLTGLYNHRYFQERAEQEVARARRYRRSLALLFADIDHFKAYNDRFGHPAGDAVLVTVARLLSSHSRRTDVVAHLREGDIVARYGGEEFVILLPETDRAAGLVVADRLRAAIAVHPYRGVENGPGGKLTISVGVASVPADASDRGGLIACADIALYAAKRAGRDRVVEYTPELERGKGQPDA